MERLTFTSTDDDRHREFDDPTRIDVSEHSPSLAESLAGIGLAGTVEPKHAAGPSGQPRPVRAARGKRVRPPTRLRNGIRRIAPTRGILAGDELTFLDEADDGPFIERMATDFLVMNEDGVFRRAWLTVATDAATGCVLDGWVD